MHARLPLLLATLAGAAALPLGLLIDERGDARRDPRPHLVSVLHLEPRTQHDRPPLPQPAFRAVSAQPIDALDDDEAGLDLLRADLASARAEIARLEAELEARDDQWEARLGRSRLEDDLARMLELEFPDIVAESDPNSGDDKLDEMVEMLMHVARSLEPDPVVVDGVERVGPPIALADVRQRASDFTIRQLSARLRWWNLQLALAPGPSYWVACGAGGGSSGWNLTRVAQVGDEVVELETIDVERDDPRIEDARSARQRVADARARDLETLLALPAGTLD